MKRRRSSSPARSRPALGNDYEVFLSFKGSDTRQSFTDCLYHNMKGVGIRIFRDDNELRVGEIISGELLQALNNSKIYIPIFSKTYASSKWCLMELVKMLENTSKSGGKKVILPIFFDVEPDDVKLKTPLYSNALLQHEKKYDADGVKAWREALVEVDEIKGWTLKNQGHGKLIELVTKEVLIKLNIKYMKLSEHFVEDYGQINAIMELLDIKSKGVRFVGLHGIGGIGKTTMAKVIFNKLYSQFDHCCFLENVRETSQCKGIEYLQKQLLSTILGSRFVDEIYNTDVGMYMIKQRLCSKKVLIVLDDLDEEKQLKKLAGNCDWFGSGSRIIVTTREKRVLKSDVGKSYEQVIPHSRGISPYELQEMGFDQALQLFCKHAFRRDFPLKGYGKFSRQIVSTLGKLPLAIEVIGSYLFDSYMNQDLWEETLKKIHKIPPREVQDTLMISYNKLDFNQRQVFLDIACFFIDEDKTYPIFMWDDCDYFPLDAIKVLLEKSLIKIGEDNKFWMHDQVRDLGRHIVYEGLCRYSSKHSRLWNHEDALNMLKNKEGNEDAEALCLNSACGYIVTYKEVASLQKLRFLRLRGINFVGNFQNLLSNLRWLSWHYCPPSFAAMNFCPVNLVILDLSYSSITEEWGGWSQIKMIGKLKVLDLTGCHLIMTPNFSNFMSLEILILARCCNLTIVDRSIGKLEHLKTLNMEYCYSLQGLPEEIGFLKSLSRIILPEHCSKFSKLPETIGNLKALSSLTIKNLGVNRLPYSIGELVNLTSLTLDGCTKIKELPETIGNLKALSSLTIKSLGVNRLPNSIGRLVNLTNLSLQGCTEIKEFPETIGNLKALSSLMIRSSGVNRLPYSIGGFVNLTNLFVDECIEIKELPETIGNLKALSSLTISSLQVNRLPYSIIGLENLTSLTLELCNEINELPKTIGNLKALSNLSIIGLGVNQLPYSIGGLVNLTNLSLYECMEIEELPETIGDLKSLVELDLSGSGIVDLPDSIQKLERLKVLRMEFTPMKTLPKWIGMLEMLEVLNIDGCGHLSGEIPEDIGSLSQLRTLSLSCTDIFKLPRTINRLSCLETLDLTGCNELQQLPELPSSLKSLRLPSFLWSKRHDLGLRCIDCCEEGWEDRLSL